MHLFYLLCFLLYLTTFTHIPRPRPPTSVTCHGSLNGGLVAERPFAVFLGRARPRPLRRPIGRKGCAPPVQSRAGCGAAAKEESDGSAVSGGEGSDLSRQRLALWLLPSHAKERFTSSLIIRRRRGRRSSTCRTNVGCCAGCNGGIGVSDYARIFDVGGRTCDHVDAQSNFAVSYTTSGMPGIPFF